MKKIKNLLVSFALAMALASQYTIKPAERSNNERRTQEMARRRAAAAAQVKSLVEVSIQVENHKNHVFLGN